MDRPDNDQLNLLMPPVTEDDNRVNRYIQQQSCGTSGLASVVSIFFIGLVLGAAGGLLLGATAVVLLQSLELLANNRLLMDQLEKYITDGCYSESKIKYFLKWENNNQMHDIRIAIFAVIFGVFSSTFSLAVGIYTGSSTYSLVIKNNGEAAMEKALGFSGLVCLMGVTLTGCILGVTLESFLSIVLNVNIGLWCLISVVVSGWMFPTLILFSSSHLFVLVCGIVYTPFTAAFTYVLSFLLEIRLILGAVLVPVILAAKVLEKSQSLKMTITPVPLMLIISDLYNIAGQHIVALQSPTSTNTNSVVLEAIFVGVLASLLWVVTVGMSLFVSCQGGGAGKTCVTAAASGAAVLGLIKLALPVLGLGPSVGALMGVAGAVGVSFSAAVAVTDRYGQVVDHYGLVGRVGVIVGAVVGAFLTSCTHRRLSGMFMGLCAATIHSGAFLNLLLHSTPWRFTGCLTVYIVSIFFTFYSFTVLFSFIFMNFNVMEVSLHHA